MPIDTEELDYMVRKILGAYPEEKRWPINIIDEVFSIIEKNYPYLHQYNRLIGKDKKDKDTVNQIIGKLVKQHTGLETLREVTGQLSSLNKNYTELGSTTDGND
jgi:hypothetical protein